MRKIKDAKKVEAISFDISDFSEKEVQDLFRDLPVKSLKQWLQYYVNKEQYEICKIIKQYIDIKTG